MKTRSKFLRFPIIALSILLISPMSTKAQNNKLYRLTGSTTEAYNLSLNQYEKVDSISTIFNGGRGSELVKNKELIDIFSVYPDTFELYSWDGNAYSPTGIVYFEFYQAGEPIKAESWVFNGNSYDPDGLSVYSYDSSGNVISYNSKIWVKAESKWRNSSRSETVSQGNKKITTSQDWNVVQAKWQNTSLNIKSLSPAGFVMSSVSADWNLTNLSWDSTNKRTYTYNTWDGSMATEIYEKWDNSYSEWDIQYQYIYAYSAGNLISKTRQTWNPSISQWEDDDRESWNYDQYGWLTSFLDESYNRISTTEYEWQTAHKTDYSHNTGDYYYNSTSSKSVTSWGSNSWKNNYKFEYSFTTFDKIDQVIKYDGDGNLWNPELKTKYYYEEYSPTGLRENDYNKLRAIVYPTPSSSRIFIQFDNAESSTVELKVYDISGKMVSQKDYGHKPAGSIQISWNASAYDVGAGTYFYILKAGNSVSSGQIVINK